MTLTFKNIGIIEVHPDLKNVNLYLVEECNNNYFIQI